MLDYKKTTSLHQNRSDSVGIFLAVIQSMQSRTHNKARGCRSSTPDYIPNMAFITDIFNIVIGASITTLAIVSSAISTIGFGQPSTEPSQAASTTSYFTWKRNKVCYFYFNTENSNHNASVHEWKRRLKFIKDADMRKINFAGGEPFL